MNALLEGEFVIHVKDDYDYRMKSKMRDEIIEILKLAYITLKKKNLPIYGVVLIFRLLTS